MVTKFAVLAVASLTLSVHALMAQEPMKKYDLIKGQERGILDASAKGEASKVAAKAAPVKPHEAGSQLKLRKVKQPAAAEASQSLTKVLLPLNGTSVAGRVAGLEGADLNPRQVGLSMQRENMDKAKVTSILDLDVSRRLSLLARADEMLKKDLTQHRAKVQEWKANWKANRTLLTRHGREDITVSEQYQTATKQAINQAGTEAGYRMVSEGIALGTAQVLSVMIHGGDSEAVKQAAIDAALGVVTAVAGNMNPMLGLAVTLAASLLSGLIGGQDKSSPAQELFETIMAQVQTMISQALLEAKLDTVKDKITGIFEELEWVPDLVDQLESSEIKMSYLLTVQHDIATNARAVFGDCFDNRFGSECLEWEKAGTIDLAMNFAELHLNLISVIYQEAGNSGSKTIDGFQTMLAQKAYSLTKNYRCLLYHSYLDFGAKRQADLTWATSSNGECSQRVCNRNRRRKKSSVCDATCCSYNYRVKDSFTGREWTHSSGGSYAPTDGKWTGCNVQGPKDWIWNKANNEMKSDLETYRDKIDKLVGNTVLSATDNQNPCTDHSIPVHMMR